MVLCDQPLVGAVVVSRDQAPVIVIASRDRKRKAIDSDDQ